MAKIMLMQEIEYNMIKEVMASLKEQAKDEGQSLGDYRVDQHTVHSMLSFNNIAEHIAARVNKRLETI